MAGFTNRRRAPLGRGGRLLGKTTMFFNVFPRFVEVAAELSVVNCQVRAGFSQDVRLVFVGAR
jgi:hypothetical protein